MIDMDTVKDRLKEPSTWLAMGVPLVALGIVTEDEVQQFVAALGGFLSLFGVIPEGKSKPNPAVVEAESK